MTKGVASHDYHGFNSPTFRCITAKSASDGDRSCVGWVLMERQHVEDAITSIVSANWLRVFVFENTRAHSDASPRVISGGDMRGKATDTHGAW